MSSAMLRLKALQAKGKFKEKENDSSSLADSNTTNDNNNSGNSQIIPGNEGDRQVSESLEQTKSLDATKDGLSSGQSDKSNEGINSPVLESPKSTDSPSRCSGNTDNPLMMQLAELEQALTQKLPEFRTILRDIHAKLRQDPEVVTILTEDEISLIVQGLTVHANVDIVAPKVVKAAKKAAKTPITAGDL